MKGSQSALAFSTAHASFVTLAQTDTEAGIAARTQLLQDHERLMLGILRRFRVPPRRLDEDRYDDALQAARTAFLQALGLYDAARGAALWTFARPYVRGAVRVAATAFWYATSLPLEDASDVEDEPSQRAFAAADNVDQREAVRDFVDRLSPLQRDLVIRVFWYGETQAQVKNSRGTSATAVSKQLKAVMKRGQEELAMWNPHLESAEHLPARWSRPA